MWWTVIRINDDMFCVCGQCGAMFLARISREEDGSHTIEPYFRHACPTCSYRMGWDGKLINQQPRS